MMAKPHAGHEFAGETRQVVEIIAAKRDSRSLTKNQIASFINGYVNGSIPDYQMSALLMAVCLNGMMPDETAALTEVMLESGAKVVFDRGNRIYVDKHSSGGVGDKVSIVLAPLMAACGLRVPMLSGRGLGHTGGTLDKLESIAGFRTDLSIDEFKRGVDSVGCIISGQTEEIAPADRKMYALRDVTATVESIPLICASILSKKFAAGPNSIVFDIKCGNGAFMKTVDKATELGESLTRICGSMGRRSAYVITDMNQPLGNAVGNALEIDEAVAALQGKGARDLMEVTLALGDAMLTLGGIASSGDGRQLQKDKIADGSAFAKLQDMVDYQGGDAHVLLARGPIIRARKSFDVFADRAGFIKSIDTRRLGNLVVEMDGGRRKLEDVIDHSVGFVIHKKLSERIEKGDPLITVHSNGKLSETYLKAMFDKCFEIDNEPVESPRLIIRNA